MKGIARTRQSKLTGPAKVIAYKVDLNSFPPLTESQKAELESLAALPDDQIDLSDIPNSPTNSGDTPSSIAFAARQTACH